MWVGHPTSVENELTLLKVKIYFAGMGSWRFFVVVIGACFVGKLSDTAQTWFLGYWASQYETHDPSEIYVPWSVLPYARTTQPSYLRRDSVLLGTWPRTVRSRLTLGLLL